MEDCHRGDYGPRGVYYTTPDPVNMGLLMVPLSFLYVLSILMAALAARGLKRKWSQSNSSFYRYLLKIKRMC